LEQAPFSADEEHRLVLRHRVHAAVGQVSERDSLALAVEQRRASLATNPHPP